MMISTNKALAAYKAVDDELDNQRRDAARWRYYASKVAEKLGISLAEMTKEIDGAIESERAEGQIGSDSAT